MTATEANRYVIRNARTLTGRPKILVMYYTHLYLHNRGIIITPFHNMMLVSPVTTDEDIDRLIRGWDDCIAELAEIGTYNR